MIYIENNLEKQDLFIPRNDGSGCYVSPYDKGYQDGYHDGLDDCGAGCTLQEKEVAVTATTQTVRPDDGYVGMDVVNINASQFVLEKYTEGYHDGEEDGVEEQKSKLASTAFTQNGIYRREDGWSEVEVDVAPPPCPELGPDLVSLNGGWDGDETYYPSGIGKDGFSEFRVYDNGYGRKKYNDGVNAQKALLSSTAFTQNDTYTNQDGWSAVTVNVPTGTSCNLESKTETITAETQTILPSSGYDGMSSVSVDASSFAQEKYDEGFTDGQASVPPCPPCPEIESAVTYGIGSGFTGATITPSSGYDGMAEVTITDNGYGQEKYDEGHGDGYNEGFTDGQTDILSGMTATAFTQNGIYSNPSGWSGVTVAVPQTGSSCNLQQKAITLESGDTSPWAVAPDAGYDGMSGVTITDNGYGQEKYDEGHSNGYEEGYQDGSIASCNLQEKSVTLTATTECIYPDTTGYEYYLGFESPSWAIKNLIDTGVYPTQTSTARIKYKGRGVRSDRIVGSIDGYQGCNDNNDYRVFDAISLTVDVGSARRTVYSISSITETDVIYDITFGNAYVYDNINETYLLQNGTQNVNTGYTYTVDVGSFWFKELIIEDNGVTLFNGTPREENGVAGIYDSVSNSFFTLFSGSTGSTVMHAEPVGYTGLASVCVDATDIYNQGYEDGKKETEGSNNYFTFEAIEDGEIGFHYEECDTSVPQTYTALTVSYSINGGAWNSITSTTAATNQIVVNAGDIVRFKSTNSGFSNYSSNGCLVNHKITNTNNCYVYGNIMSLLYGDNFDGEDEITEAYAFSSFFSGNQKIYLHPTKPLSLPATTLTNSCYAFMFKGCNITSSPKLPATTLAISCYRHMFEDCINLSVAPSLPATNLADGCYSHMFEGCTSLAVAPELPATTLFGGCYDSMFENCTSLTAAPSLMATTVPTSGFFGAYSSMFQGCSSLSYIKCNATTFDGQYGFDYWVYGVAANGVFLKNSSMSNWPTGDNGIPSGWTVRDIQ